MSAIPNSPGELKEQVKKTYIDSETYRHYIALVYRNRKRLDIQFRWVVAATSCAPFVSKLNQSSTVIWPWILAVVPLIAIALPLIDFVKVISSASALHEAYSEMVPDIKEIWLEVSSQSILTVEGEKKIKAKLVSIDRRIAKLGPLKLHIPDIKKLRSEAERHARTLLPSGSSSGGGTVHNFSLGGGRF